MTADCHLLYQYKGRQHIFVVVLSQICFKPLFLTETCISTVSLTWDNSFSEIPWPNSSQSESVKVSSVAC